MAEETKKLKPKDASSDSGKPDKDGKAKDKPPKEKVKFTVRMKKFLKDYKSEIKKIVWPTRQQVIKNTGVVVFVIVVVAAMVGALDLLFGKGVEGLAALAAMLSA